MNNEKKKKRIRYRIAVPNGLLFYTYDYNEAIIIANKFNCKIETLTEFLDNNIKK